MFTSAGFDQPPNAVTTQADGKIICVGPFTTYDGVAVTGNVVRLNTDERPMDREQDLSSDYVRIAGMLCRDKQFWEYLHEGGQLFEKNEAACVEWLQSYLNITSRSDIKVNKLAQAELKALNEEYKAWKS